MKTNFNNRLKICALISLFVTSYIPLFLIVIIKQIKDNYMYLNWGGINKDAIKCFFIHFGMSGFLSFVSFVGMMGICVLLRNFESNVYNGNVVNVKKINNRNSESIGYIATYIVPFIASDFSSLIECGIFISVLTLIFLIYVNSNMILINPLLNIKYSLLEVEYTLIGNFSDERHNALVITETKDYREDVFYYIYQIGFKLYYGKERKFD